MLGPAAETPPWTLGQRALKRGLDFLLSSSALVVLGPGLLAVGLLVRWTSPGPALFRQERIGRGGRPFFILKFRTMHSGAEACGPQITAAGDARVTPLGRILRKTKVDELPQLLNVALGHMSLVGPRPEVPLYVREYSPQDRAVLAVRPGITDLASIAFRDEESILAQYPDRERAYREVVLPRKLALAHQYIREQGLFTDLGILLRTFVAIARPS
jgi:lipopolysaccharide/colanic/teichoic acid biosynthesis glycosyltransferase